ncbi:TetR family transcriptional regulator, partial [Arthrobacter sp. zg-Y411]|nr:TetR family transcriptional regulator [Arthrobacter zhangbolii]
MNLREQQRSETRQRFIDTAMRLFLDNGFSATSMNQIAGGGGGRPPPHEQHFTNKPPQGQ